ncbi:MAG: hypothetical protein ACE5H4_10565 [Candidatus Thorarchaeota archaeon]
MAGFVKTKEHGSSRASMLFILMIIVVSILGIAIIVAFFVPDFLRQLQLTAEEFQQMFQTIVVGITALMIVGSSIIITLYALFTSKSN